MVLDPRERGRDGSESIQVLLISLAYAVKTWQVVQPEARLTKARYRDELVFGYMLGKGYSVSIFDLSGS